MGITELLITAVALSMDAFAVAVCKGLATGKVRARHMLITGAWFGGFQALMPLIGYLLGQTFKGLITPVDHWITFLLCSSYPSSARSPIRSLLLSENECPSSSAVPPWPPWP